MNTNQTIRLFTGTFIDPVIFKDSYTELSKEISKYFGGKFVEYNNLHFSWQFIGDFPVEQLDSLKVSLNEFIRDYEEELNIEGMMAFPNSRYPRVLVIPVYCRSKKFQEIYTSTNSILSDYGYKPDQRHFKPHTTLIRIKENKTEISNELFAKYRDYKFGTMQKFRYNLISSELTSSGPVYKIL